MKQSLPVRIHIMDIPIQRKKLRGPGDAFIFSDDIQKWMGSYYLPKREKTQEYYNTKKANKHGKKQVPKMRLRYDGLEPV